MSAPAISLSVEAEKFQFAELTIPTRLAVKFQVFSVIKEVRISCKSDKGYKYHAAIQLQLQSIEKVQQCVALLLSHTRALIVSPPKARLIEYDSSSLKMQFYSSELAIEFYTYYAPHFFPLREFKTTLIADRLQFDKKLSAPSDLQSIAQWIETYTKRIFQASKSDLLTSPTQASVRFHRHFTASAEIITQTKWISGKKEITEVKAKKVMQWLTKVDPLAEPLLKKGNWKEFRQRLINAKNVKKEVYTPLIEILDIFLQEEPFSARNLYYETERLRKTLTIQVGFSEIFFSSFTQ